MTQYGFYFDSTRCTGCRTCEMACKDYKDLPATIAFRKVYDYEGGAWTDAGDGTYTSDAFAYHVSLGCQHCAMPACMAKCPQGAITKDTETGLVAIDQEKCTGAGVCVETCPYNVPIVDKELGKGVKCDGCADRVAEGARTPSAWTPARCALEFGDIEELRSARGNGGRHRADAVARPDDALHRHPSLPGGEGSRRHHRRHRQRKEVTGVAYPPLEHAPWRFPLPARRVDGPSW